MTTQTQTAYAKSAYSDPQNIASAIGVVLALLADPEFASLIPLAWMPKILAVSGVLNIVLRIFKGTHPVANIPPAEVKPIEVKKLRKTQQGSEKQP